MKPIYISIVFCLVLWLMPNEVDAQKVPAAERQALMDLYNATNGPNWTNNTNWGSNKRVTTWDGVTVVNGTVTQLLLGSNGLVGTLPSSLGQLSGLQELYLDQNLLSGSIPSELGQLSNLRLLFLNACRFSGSIPTELGQLTNLTSLILHANQLTGSIPVELGQLSNLTILSLYSNQLTGSIPPQLGALNNLRTLSLLNNQLTGVIPLELGQLTSLRTLRLTINQLTGSIPVQLGQLVNLTELSLNSNQLTGAIPQEFELLSNLTSLSLSSNELFGIIPSGLASLPSLNDLYLKDNNFIFSNFEAAHPSFVSNLTNYQFSPQADLDIAESLSVTEGGNITLTSTALTSANNSYQWYKDGVAISGATSKDYTITNATNADVGVYHFQATNSVVTGLTLTRNPITLSVDIDACGVTATERQALVDLYTTTDGTNWTNTWDLNASICDWYGVTVTSGSVTSLELGNNNLSGTLGSSISDLTGLITLRLNDNNLEGNIPSSIGSMGNLRFLYLTRNELTGSIPSEIGSASSLRQLDLNYNNLTGSIPSSLENLLSLQYLNLDRNQLSGSIPAELGNLTNLIEFDITLNQLSGPLPSELGGLSSLKRFYAQNNQIDGSIPIEFGDLPELESLLLNGNVLSGSIPYELGNLPKLTNLILNYNQLSGTIPAQLGDISTLLQLDLGFNQLTGSIPTEVVNLINLRHLYLENNQLSGDIPDVSTLPLNYFYIDNNAFIFNNFESENATYVANIQYYRYSPQSDVDGTESLSVTEGGDITLTSQVLTSANNTYQWYKDGVAISGATSKDYTITNATNADAGVYHFQATNSVVTGLTLTRNPITLSVDIDACGVTATERQALVDLYNATNGPNWTNTWDLNAPVCDWIGVEVLNGNVTQLNLANNALQGSISSSLGGLENLERLELALNLLAGAIPPELGGLTNLTVLNLFGNQLSGDIPTELGSLGNLTGLNIGNNQLTGSIPPSLGSLSNLTSLGVLNNLLTGRIPESLSTLSNLQTFYFYDNRFVFSDFETEHLSYTTNLTNYLYAPQENVDLEESLSVTEGDNITLTSNVLSSLSNNYQWYKDGVAIPSAVSKDYMITGATAGDAGVYHFQATNSIITGLTLTRNPITLTVDDSTDTCVSAAERQALVDLYNATNGPNWTNTWDLNGSVCDWYGVTVSGGIVTALNLNNNALNGTLPGSLENLSSLQNLNLSNNALSGSLPLELGSLGNLDLLFLANNQFNGPLPTELGNLNNLRVFHAYGNQLEGPLPASLGGLTALEQLELAGNSITGSIPTTFGGMTSLQTLNISNNQLSGNIPSELGSLDQLTQLNLFLNQLTGPIPVEIGDLSALQQLQLHNNTLNGTLPTSLGNLSNLTELIVSFNQITGGVPTSLGGLTNLVKLQINNNQLSGIFPDIFGNLTGLTVLSFNNNLFTGNLPPSLDNLVNLTELWFGNNQFSGPVPDFSSFPLVIFSMENNAFVFSDFEAQYNIYSTIPNYYHEPQADVDDAYAETVLLNGSITLTSQVLTSPNNSYQWYKDGVAIPGAVTKDYTITGATAADAGVYHFEATNTVIADLTLTRNPITLTVDANACGVSAIERQALVDLYNATNGPNWTNTWDLNAPVCDWYGITVTNNVVTRVQLSENGLSGTINATLENLNGLTVLDLHDNSLTGTIPSELGSLTNLQQLYLAVNQLSGSIPPSLGGLSGLTQLMLYQNQLSGSIPAELDGLVSLISLELNQNQLTGAIPSELGSLLNLQTLYLYSNSLSGSIPSTLGALTQLQRLYLFNNQLNGTIPSELGNLSQLLYLDLSQNQLTGPVPSELGDLSNLIRLHLFLNQLNGAIPSSLGNLGSLEFMYLHNNQFSGDIPAALGLLSNLQELYLHNNSLSGSIPPELGDLSSLTQLYLYNNQLTGTIPDTLGNLLTLTHLSLNFNQLSGNLPASLTSLTALQGISINDNQLSGTIPDFTGLPLINFQFHNNAFIFSDFEAEHTAYKGITTYIHAPQAKVDLAYVETIVEGENITLTSNVLLSPNNSYQWYKNAAVIPGATSKDYTITGATLADAGEYYFEATNSIVDGLTLRRNTITLTVGTGCGVSPLERQALVDLHTNTDGLNWTNTWDLNAPVCDWYGVTVVNDVVTRLELGSNGLIGTLPSGIGALSNLQVLNLTKNALTGVLPTEMGDLSSIREIRLRENQLNGSIPASLGNLSSLLFLDLDRNQLTGGIPLALTGLGNLTYLGLGYNDLGGTIPPELGQMTTLQYLGLSQNELTGTVPSTIGNLVNLNFLDFGENMLEGSLPSSLSNLTQLATFYFNNDNLSGPIPDLTSSPLTIFYFPGNAFIFSDFETEHLAYDSNIATYEYSPQANVDLEETIPVTEGGSITLTSQVLTSPNNNYQWFKDGVAISGATSKDYTITGATLADAGEYYFEATNSIVDGLTLRRNTITLTVGTGSCAVSGPQRQALVDLFNATGGLNWTNNTNWNTPAPVCDWYGVTVASDTRVVTVDLNNNGLTGTIPASIDDLIHLTTLNLYNNQLTGNLPPEIGNLTALINLNLSNNALNGPLPTSIGGLGALGYLFLANNQFSGTLPDEIGNLGNLVVFQAYNNLFDGPLPQTWSTMLNLEQLNLADNSITGNLPTELGSLSALKLLNLSRNQLSGSIPTTLGNLTNLTQLSLPQNQLSGTLPDMFASMSQLEFIYLYNNQLSGPLPPSLGSLTNLQILQLQQNAFGSTIPTTFGNLSSLTVLLLNNNQLTGTIPSALTNISTLQSLTVNNNLLSGIVPDFTGQPLNTFQIHRNAFIFSDFETEHPTYVSNITTYAYFPQADVDLEETLPVTEGGSITLTSQVLTSPNNSYQWYKDGVAIPNAISKDYEITNATSADAGVYYFEATNSVVTGLTLIRNSITVTVTPAGACNVPDAEKQALLAFFSATVGTGWTNTSQGNQPWDTNTPVCDWFGITVTNDRVTRIELPNNNLQGTFTTDLSPLTALVVLNLQNNAIGGSLPSTLQNLGSLTYLYLNHNDFVGNIPSTWASLSSLQELFVNHNQLGGTIQVLTNLTSLTRLGLNNNQFMGAIPPELDALTNLQQLYLNDNQFTDDIPDRLGNLTALTDLYLGGNQLTGGVPVTFENLTSLIGLGINDNLLEGAIPAGLASIGTLQEFYFQNNAFIFSDFEAEHNTYNGQLSQYWYFPQAKVDIGETPCILEGEGITLTSTELTSPNNTYQWYKDGVAIPGAITREYTISNATVADVGVYHFLANNTIVTGLTLERYTITLCINPVEEECNEVLALMGSLDGTFELAAPVVTGTRNASLGSTGWVAGEGTPDTFLPPLTNDTTLDPDLGGAITNSPDGGVCAGGLRSGATTESIQATLTGLTAGTTYVVDFYQANASNLRHSLFSKYARGWWEVNFDGISQNTPPMEPSNAGSTPNWTRAKLEFTAGSTTAALELKVASLSSDPNAAYPVYMLLDGIRVYPKSQDPTNLACSGVETQTFCTGTGGVDLTIADLVAPQGSAVTWHSEQVGGLQYHDGVLLDELSSTFVWADDGSDDPRIAVEVILDMGAPEGDDYQAFDMASNPTVADLVVEGTNIQWYTSLSGGSPLALSTPLQDGNTYFASQDNATCRLAVDIFVGVPELVGDGFQEFCSDANPTVGDLEMPPTNVAYQIEWFADADGSISVPINQTLQDGTIYYGLQTNGTDRSPELFPVIVRIFDVANAARILYRDLNVADGFVVGELATLFQLDSTTEWYNQSLGGTVYRSDSAVLDGETYYARIGDGLCQASTVLAVTTYIAVVEEPELITCIKFLPVPTREYVISAWVREDAVVPVPVSTRDFNDDVAARRALTDLFQFLSDWSLQKLDEDQRGGLVTGENISFEVEALAENLNLDALRPYIRDFGGTNISIHDFRLEKENVSGLANSIGFSFALAADSPHRFVYRTPQARLYAYPILIPLEYHYSFLNYESLTLTFTDAKFTNGQFEIFSEFAMRPVVNGNTNLFLAYVSDNEVSSETLSAPILENVQIYDYVIDYDYQVLDYLNAKIQLLYRDGDGQEIVPDGDPNNLVFQSKGAVIDGWQRVFTTFQIPADAYYMRISLKNEGSDLNAYFDDVRIHGVDSNMKSFVYDPLSQRLMAELDESNYATFYEYDTEGGLVRVKKETEKGVFTIQETRSGNSKLNTPGGE